jgi:LmbE family N-acetylglucosaminyl deacetylase
MSSLVVVPQSCGLDCILPIAARVALPSAHVRAGALSVRASGTRDVVSTIDPMSSTIELTKRSSDQIQQVAALGDIVAVWAHPDDESYLAGGLMAIARAGGARVTCVTATNGEFADSKRQRRMIARTRRAELAAALDVLEVTDQVRLGLPDGGCEAVDPRGRVGVIAALASIITDRSPDTIVTFGPDGLTGHPDHRAVSRWTMAAVRASGSTARVLHTAATAEVMDANVDIDSRFDVFAPGFPMIHRREDLSIDLTLDGDWLDRKLRALQCHASQTTGLIDVLGVERYRRWIVPEMFVDA